MNYTLGAAAKATGKSKTTIQRAVSKGLISATKEKNGRYSIDPSELHRVFPMVSSETSSKTIKVEALRPHDDTVIQVKLEAMEAMLEREREALTEMRSDRDAWKQQATAILEDKRPQSFWKRLIGK
jgi:hypothetical protein